MCDDIKTSINMDNSFVITSIIQDFLQVAELAGIHLLPEDIEIDYRHKSPLPKGKMAVYIFYYGDICLKVGKAGSKSQPRYSSHHYDPKRSESNLAKSILKDKDNMKIDVNENNVGEWLLINTKRYNLLIDANINISCLALLETFLHCRLKPRFEGFESQI